MTANTSVIEQWIDDLRSNAFKGVKFNVEYSAVLDEDGDIMGDAALFLILRNANLPEQEDVFAWYDAMEQVPGGYHPPEVAVTHFTGIPLEDACKLMWPHGALPDEAIDRITSKTFSDVIENYVATGDVDWSLVE